jgi:hypothetical protein
LFAAFALAEEIAMIAPLAQPPSTNAADNAPRLRVSEIASDSRRDVKVGKANGA